MDLDDTTHYSKIPRLDTKQLQDKLLDVLILGAEGDRIQVEKLKILLEMFTTLPEEDTIRVSIMPRETPSGFTRLEVFKNLLEKSIYVFLFISEGFEQDSWLQLVKRVSIEYSVTHGRTIVVPVYAHKCLRGASFGSRFSFGLSGIKGLEVQLLLKGGCLCDVYPDVLDVQNVNATMFTRISQMVSSKRYMKEKHTSFDDT